MAIELKNVTRNVVNPIEQVFLVLIDKREVGLISKFKRTVGENHPWKAFKLDGSANPPKPNTMLGAFYGSRAQKLAIRAIVTDIDNSRVLAQQVASVCIAGNPTIEGQPCDDPDCVCHPSTIHGPHFDYTHQAWTVDGRYIRCGHKAESCDCYGTVHAGEIADLNDLPTAQESDADRIHRENLERVSSPPYQRREREVSSVESSLRRSN